MKRPARERSPSLLLLVLALAGIAIAAHAAAAVSDTPDARQAELAAAVRRNDVESIRALLDEGVDISPDIMIWAVNKAKIETIEVLIEGGADVNAALDLGGVQATPLGSAVAANRPDVVNLLLDTGAKTETLHLARSPLDWAKDKKRTHIIAALTAHSPGDAGPNGLDALLQAINDGAHEEIQKLLESGQDPNETDDHGDTPIHHAARKQNVEALRLLLSAGADPDLRTAAGSHAAELATGFDNVFEPLLDGSPELRRNRAVPEATPDSVYQAGARISGPCQHSGRIPLNAGCGASGTEVFTGTRISTTGWSDAVGPPLCEPVTLPPLPGTYTVAVISTASEWAGDRCYENIGKIYFSKKNSSETSTHSFTVKKGECEPGTERLADTEDYDPVEQEGFAGEMQQAIVDAFRRSGIEAGREHVTISDVNANRSLFKFQIRTSSDGCLLPHGRTIARECIREGSQKGAPRILLGSVQRFGGKTRALIRMVRTETAEVKWTGKGDADGSGSDAVSEAFKKALDAMDYKITCAEGVVR